MRPSLRKTGGLQRLRCYRWGHLPVDTSCSRCARAPRSRVNTITFFDAHRTSALPQLAKCDCATSAEPVSPGGCHCLLRYRGPARRAASDRGSTVLPRREENTTRLTINANCHRRLAVMTLLPNRLRRGECAQSSRTFLRTTQVAASRTAGTHARQIGSSSSSSDSGLQRRWTQKFGAAECRADTASTASIGGSGRASARHGVWP